MQVKYEERALNGSKSRATDELKRAAARACYSAWHCAAGCCLAKSHVEPLDAENTEEKSEGLESGSDSRVDRFGAAECRAAKAA